MEMTLYREGDLALTEEDGQLFLRAGAEIYRLASHPYEPCTCLYRGEELSAAIHNAFTLEEIRALAMYGVVTGRVNEMMVTGGTWLYTFETPEGEYLMTVEMYQGLLVGNDGMYSFRILRDGDE